MSNPMENMAVNILSKITGMSPEQMQGMATTALNMLKSLDGRLATLEEAAKETKAVMDEVKVILDALGIHVADKPIEEAETVIDEGEHIASEIDTVHVDMSNGN